MESRIGKRTSLWQWEGLTPVRNLLECLLLSLAGCISAKARIAANQKRINLRSLALRVEGTIGTEELLGKNCDKRAGFPGIDVEANIDADI